MTYPYGLLSAQSLYELEHVPDDAFLGIVTMLRID
jgi:hypothetical protein